MLQSDACGCDWSCSLGLITFNDIFRLQVSHSDTVLLTAVVAVYFSDSKRCAECALCHELEADPNTSSDQVG